MKEFNQFICEMNILQEKLITFGKKAYPKFGNVVILAGGAGSGKGFTAEHLMGIEGRTFDVDAVKKLVQASVLVAKAIKAEFGVDVKTLSLKNPDNVSKLHALLKSTRFLDGNQKAFFSNLENIPLLADKGAGGTKGAEGRKPNMIFDVTLKDIDKLKTISKSVMDLGYAKENIHIVWVLNDIEMAKTQNQKRDRVVPADILLDTHIGANQTFKDLISRSSNLRSYMDGDVWISFNKFKVDSTLINAQSKEDSVMWKGAERLITKVGDDERVQSNVFKTKTSGNGMFIPQSFFVKVKEQGKSTRGKRDISRASIRKIKEYVPNPEAWD
jgi:hypothetical protein